MPKKETHKLVLNPDAETSFEDDAHHEPMAGWEIDFIAQRELMKHNHDVEHSAQLDPYLTYDSLVAFSAEVQPGGKSSTLGQLAEELAANNDRNTTPEEKLSRNGLWLNTKLGQRGVSSSTNEKGSVERVSVDPSIKRWIEENAPFSDRFGMFVGITAEENDPVMAERADDIVIGMIQKIRDAAYSQPESLDTLLSNSENIGPLSQTAVDALVGEGMIRTILHRPDLFPSLKYDMTLLQQLLTVELLEEIACLTDLSEQFVAIDWQSLIDEMIESGNVTGAVETLCFIGSRLPAELTMDQVVKVMAEDDELAFQYLRLPKGKVLLRQYSALDILEKLRGGRSIAYMISSRIIDHLTEDEIRELLSRDPVLATVLVRSSHHLTAFSSESFMEEFIDEHPELPVGSLKCARYSQVFQSKIFDRIKSDFIANSDLEDRLKMVHRFTDLDTASHQFLIDECELAILKQTNFNVARGLFVTTNASNEILETFDKKYTALFQEREAVLERIRIENNHRQERLQAEVTYFDNESIILQLAQQGETVEVEELVDYLDFDHVVKMAPHLGDQVGDTTRTNVIRRHGDIPAHPTTEAEMLSEFDLRLKKAVDLLLGSDDVYAKQLRSLYENITFIGDKEYQEAVTAIATYWKHALEKNPKLQIFVHTGISESGSIKSDRYMFDKILEHFSDEELEHYSGRLVTDVTEIEKADPEQLRVILLDDWTISGSQLIRSASNFAYHNPQFEKCIEIQLIAASKERIALGIEGVGFLKQGESSSDVPIPVRAYYLAHDAPLVKEGSERGAHITGAHSSVDYGFDYLIDDAQTYFASSRTDVSNLLKYLPLTNIARVYREPGYRLTNLQRYDNITRLNKRGQDTAQRPHQANSQQPIVNNERMTFS